MAQGKRSAAAFCAECELIFEYEKRDVFSGEVHCPGCAGRCARSDRGGLATIRRRHPRAEIYRAG
jgi:hypothetical protein